MAVGSEGGYDPDPLLSQEVVELKSIHFLKMFPNVVDFVHAFLFLKLRSGIPPAGKYQLALS